MARLHPARAKQTFAASDLRELLSQAGGEKSVRHFARGRTIFRAGDRATTFFLIEQGRIKISAISKEGKEAILLLPGHGDFVGEEALLQEQSTYLNTATAIVDSSLILIRTSEGRRLLREHQRFSQAFLSFLLSENKQLQESLADQLFEDSEKRLAKILLSLAGVESEGQPGTYIPGITQQTFAEMVGTTRPRISFFMNRFRKRGFIEYRDRELYVNKSLWNYVHQS
jgi:CRP/FNR family transcriptional regulator, cyclic AMP receptor protein